MTLSESMEILESIKERLIEEYEKGNVEDETIKEEIRALKNITRFMNIIFKSFPKYLNHFPKDL
jgi:hypothetical protein